MLSTFPNVRTPKDELVLHSTIKSGLCKFLYDLSGSQVTITAFDEKLNLVKCYSESIDLYAAIDNCIKRNDMDVDLALIRPENFLPSNQTSFAEFKSSCMTEMWIENGVVNSNSPVVQSIVNQSSNLPTAENIHIIYNKQTKPFVLYLDNDDSHGHFYYHSEKQVVVCDSLDVALKFAFEDSDYKSADLRRFEEYLASDEAQESMDTFAEEFRSSMQEQADFVDSERFSQLTKTITEHLIEHNTSITESNCLYAGFESSEEFYYYMDAAFKVNGSTEDKSTDFRTFICHISKVKLCLTHGQGSLYYIELAEKSNVK